MGIIRAGILLIIYTAIVVILYLVLSSPFNSIMTTFEDANMSATDTQIEYHAGYIRIVFDMCFGIAGLVGIIFFAMWAYHREPDWEWRKYR